MMANSAFYYGVLRTLSEEDRPLWTKMSFAAAHQNFLEAAQHGMDARLYWPGLGEVTPDELVLRQLLPMARRGPAALGGGRRGVRPVSRRHRGPRQDRPQRLGLAGGDGAGAAGARHGPAGGAGRDAAAVLRADAQQRARAHMGDHRLGAPLSQALETTRSEAKEGMPCRRTSPKRWTWKWSWRRSCAAPRSTSTATSTTRSSSSTWNGVARGGTSATASLTTASRGWGRSRWW